jgi:hypothetical protein
MTTEAWFSTDAVRLFSFPEAGSLEPEALLS